MKKKGLSVAFLAPDGGGKSTIIKGITESREFVSTAINLLANKAVNFTEFPFRSFREEELPEMLDKYAQLYSSGAALPEQYDIAKFIF